MLSLKYVLLVLNNSIIPLAGLNISSLISKCLFQCHPVGGKAGLTVNPPNRPSQMLTTIMIGRQAHATLPRRASRCSDINRAVVHFVCCLLSNSRYFQIGCWKTCREDCSETNTKLRRLNGHGSSFELKLCRINRPR